MYYAEGVRRERAAARAAPPERHRREEPAPRVAARPRRRRRRTVPSGAAARCERSAPSIRPRRVERLRGASSGSARASLAQVLVRRGLGDARRRARAFLAPRSRHDPRRVRGHRRGRRADPAPRRAPARRSPSTATTTSTASARPRSSCARCGALGARRRAGSCRAASTTATASRRRPSSGSPRAGTRAARHRRLRDHRGRGGRAARARSGSTSSSPTTTRRAPTARCPTRRSCIRRSCGYPCADLCAGGRRLQARRGAAGRAGPRPARRRRATSTSSASPRSPTSSRCAARTAAWCAPGCGRCAGTRRPGLRALMRVARVDPSRLDARALGFRLGAAHQRRRPPAPRRRRRRAAAHRRRGARATRSPTSSTAPTPSAGACRAAHPVRGRGARSREQGPSDRPARAYVLAGEGWHPGVIGIVASRIAERHHRPSS